MEDYRSKKGFESGTTTVGVIGSGLVVLAADKRATLGSLKASKEAEKVFKIDDNIAITIAGSVGDAQKIVRIMRAQLKLHKLEDVEISVKGAATLLANILQSNKYFPYFNQFIMGGVHEDKGHIFDLDFFGGLMEHTKFTSTGSGSPIALGVLEDSYKADLPEKEVVKLAIRAIRAASERDINSGDGISLAVIDKSGFKQLAPKEIENYF